MPLSIFSGRSTESQAILVTLTDRKTKQVSKVTVSPSRAYEDGSGNSLELKGGVLYWTSGAETQISFRHDRSSLASGANRNGSVTVFKS